MADRLDIIIFGASGFTGIHCIPYIAKLSKQNGRNLSWGIAGRSEEKLKQALQDVGKKIEADLDAIPVVIADISDDESLVNMAKRAKLIINCVGPYRFYGEAVVKACIEAGTHHIDVSGEPEYMEKMQLEHHEAAEEKGVYAISACGLDSIPTDCGIVYLQQNFEGTLNSVETYLKMWSEDGAQGSAVNYGTWESAVHSLGNTGKLSDIRSRFYQKYKKPPTYPPKLKSSNCPHKSKHVDGWVLPFLGADRSVARRTQGYLYEIEDKRPVQVSTYFTVPSLIAVIFMIIYGMIFGILAKFKIGRKLLLAYPELFSAGLFSKKPPSEETIEKAWFAIDFYGEGWKEKLANKDDQYTTPIDTKIRARVKGPNPGYGSTCLALVMAGIIVLTETDKLANNGRGGIYPPGAAFAKTSLVKQLNENGLSFEIIAQQDI